MINNTSQLLNRIAGKFGREFNLAVWRLAWAPPNLITTKFYIRQNFVNRWMNAKWNSSMTSTLVFHCMKHDDVIKIRMWYAHMHDCQSSNLNSTNIYFWAAWRPFRQYNSRQIFRLYGIWLQNRPSIIIVLNDWGRMTGQKMANATSYHAYLYLSCVGAKNTF